MPTSRRTLTRKTVDRLLASPHYGERMALAWLDLARFADTHGYHIDSQRDMWRWREWVINAFNTNLPYDQFVIQQLAGDMLAGATLEQKIASGFNRNHPINFEGGAIPEEYAAAYIFDRIDTTATAFLGLTVRCAQCHDHKYDPITQKDYYRFYALFHNVPEAGLDGQVGNAMPYLKAPSPEQEAQTIEYANKIAGLENARKNRQVEAQQAMTEWIKTASANADKTPVASEGLVANYALDENTGAQVQDAIHKQPAGTIKGTVVWKPGKIGNALNFDGSNYVEIGSPNDKTLQWERTDKFSYGAWIFPNGMDSMTVLSRMNEAEGFRGYDLYLQGGRAFVHLIHKWDENAIRVNTKAVLEAGKWHHVFVTYDGSSKAKGVHIYVDGKPADLDITHDKLTNTIQTASAPFTIGRRTPGAPFKGLIDDVRAYDRELSANDVAALANADNLKQLLAIAPDKRSNAQKAQIAAHYFDTVDAPYKTLTLELTTWKQKQADLEKAIPTTMVMSEMAKPRDSFILVRGQYDRQGEKVTPGMPEFLPVSGDFAPNRLGLAQWLVSPSQPLTSRVAVNRYWQMLFGTGLVKTAEDFGTQGERPSHPELLDWLATRFAQGTRGATLNSPWDVKALLRLLVTSSTYRQASKVTPRLMAKDPENRLAGARSALPIAGRVYTGSGAGCGGTACTQNWRAKRETLPAGRPVGRDFLQGQFFRAVLRAGSRREFISAQHVHVLEAHGSAARHCKHSMPRSASSAWCAARSRIHAATGACPDERSDVCGSQPQTGRADADGRRQQLPSDRINFAYHLCVSRFAIRLPNRKF